MTLPDSAWFRPVSVNQSEPRLSNASSDWPKIISPIMWVFALARPGVSWNQYDVFEVAYYLKYIYIYLYIIFQLNLPQFRHFCHRVAKLSAKNVFYKQFIVDSQWSLYIIASKQYTCPVIQIFFLIVNSSLHESFLNFNMILYLSTHCLYNYQMRDVVGYLRFLLVVCMCFSYSIFTI